MATKTSTQSGNWSDGSTWVGGIKPTTGDIVVIAAGHTVDVNEDTAVLGSNASGVGVGITVNGTLTAANGTTTYVNGYDTSTNKAMQIAVGGTFQPASGSRVVVTPVSAWQTIINNEGNLIADAVIFESGEPWTFTECGQTLTSYVIAGKCIKAGVHIWQFPVGTTVPSSSGSVATSGPISNVAGTAVGTPLDNSFVRTSITGGDFTPYNALANAVASFDVMSATGDYFVDCPNGMVYYYETENKNRLSITYTCKTHKWFGFGIQSQRNGDSKCILTGSTFRRMGGIWASHDSEYTQQSVLLNYRTNGVVNPAREGKITGCTFEYCIVPIQVYNSTNNAGNYLDLTANQILYTPRLGGTFTGCILFGYAHYIDISGCVLNTMHIICSTIRGVTYLKMRNITGKACCDSLLPIGSTNNSLAENCVIEDTGGWADAGGFQSRGIAGAPNTYKNNVLTYGNRCGRVGSYMIVEDNKFIQYHHHGFVAPISHGYYSGISIKRNQIVDAQRTGDMGGGWTLGYNYTTWLDDVEISNNTFDNGNRSIMFNDAEGTKVLGTRLKIFNNNLTNAYNGITQPTGDASNQTKKQLLRLDYNNEYGFTTASNVKQATFVKGGNEYNLDATRACLGIALHNPSAATLGNKTLQLVVSGTPGTDFSMLLSWGGGTAVQLVSTQGTATSGTGATTHSTPGTLVDSGKSWTTDAYRLDQLKITSGTGSGQICMVRTHTSTTLTLMPNNIAGSLTAPASGSVYIVIASEVTLSDGTNTVQAGVYLPDVVLTAGTYTDADITTETHKVAVDPGYVSSTNFAPTNTALDTSGFGAIYIGALDVVASGVVLTTPLDGATSVARPVVLTWEAFATATDYQVDIATEDTFASPIVSTLVGNVTTYTATTLNSNTLYYWRVRAVTP